MTIPDILEKVSLVLGGSFLGTILSYFNNKRLAKSREREALSNSKKTDADIEKERIETDLKSFEILRQTWQEEFSRMRTEINSLLIKIDKLEIRCESLELENIRLKQELNSLH